MLLSDLNARAKSDAGVEYHLRDHVTDELITIDGDPVIVLVRGTVGPEVQKGSIAVNRAARQYQQLLAMLKAAEDSGEEVEVAVLEEIHQFMCARALPFVAGFKNLYREPGVPATAEDAAVFLNSTFIRIPTEDKPGRSYAKQIMDFVGEADSRLGNG